MWYSTFLIPAQPSLDAIQSLINRYSQQLETPMFKPHLSFVELHGEEKEVIDQFNNYFGNYPKLTAEFLGADYGPTFTQCVYLRMNSVMMQKQYIEAVKSFAGAERFWPHISIIYSDLKIEQRKKIVNEFTYPQKEIVFDTIALVKGEGKNPEAWEYLVEKELG